MDKLPQLITDGAVLVGVVVLAYGCWLAWHPLGFIFGGASLAAIGILSGRDIAVARRRR